MPERWFVHGQMADTVNYGLLRSHWSDRAAAWPRSDKTARLYAKNSSAAAASAIAACASQPDEQFFFLMRREAARLSPK